MPYRDPNARKEHQRRYYQEHRDKLRKQQAQYHRENRERLQEAEHNYYQENREEILKKKAQYYQQRKTDPEWRSKRREYSRTKMAERRRKNPEEARKEGRQSMQRYRQKDKVAAYAKLVEWRKANPKRYRMISQRASAHTRGKKLGAKGKFSTTYVRRLLKKQGCKCAICKKPFPPKKTPRRFEIDHIVPFIKGGSNYPINIQLLCPSCNRRKGSKIS